jgi:hypothetical protein
MGLKKAVWFVPVRGVGSGKISVNSQTRGFCDGVFYDLKRMGWMKMVR